MGVVAEMTLVQGGLGVLLVFGLAGSLWMVFLRCRARRPDSIGDEVTEKELREQVARKAAGSGVRAPQVVRNLTDSGVSSVVEMIEELAGIGNFSLAEKWARNAMRNQPNRLEIPMKLAEAYYQAGRKKAFLSVAGALMKKYEHLPEEARSRLMNMVWETAPDNSPGAAFAMIGTRAQQSD